MTQTDKRELPAGWQWVRLGDVCSEDRQVVKLDSVLAKKLPYLSLEHIESNTGRILKIPNGSIEQEGKSNSFRFDQRHVLYGKLRPYLNKVALPDFEGRSTTELIPLMPNSSIIREYLAWVLRRAETVAAAMQEKTGSRMPRADMGVLLALDVPVPHISEQRRIAATLAEQMAAVDKGRTLLEQQLNAAKQLPAAYMREVFSSEESRKWQTRKLGDICEIVARQIDPKIPEYGKLPHVNGENIESGMCRLTYLNTAAEEGMISGKYLFEAGDVLYSKLRPYLRKVVYVDFRGVCSADMYPIRVNHDLLDPIFLMWMLVSDKFTEYADLESRRARMPKLNRDQLFAWDAPLPSLDEQRHLVIELSDQMNKSGQLGRLLESQLDRINQLPAALLRRAFNGEL
jgi:type I restriction enzyme, S subunit